jgi:tetraacyldisaccharide 4'-kinase
VIVVGNLNTGGTGKTPMVEWLLQELKLRPVAVISRGYGRRSKGTFLVPEEGDAAMYGDEPTQIARNFPQAQVWVAERRQEGLTQALEKTPDLQAALLDDAFQHRYVLGHFRLLLTTWQDPFFNDWPLPMGRLRESRQGAARAHAVVVTKCPPHLNAHQRAHYQAAIQRYTRAPVFFSQLSYQPPRNLKGHPPAQSLVAALTGIAHPEPFLEHLEERYTVVEHLAYPDHHRFTPADLARLQEHLSQGIPVVTTQKDYMRLLPHLPAEQRHMIYIIRVAHTFPSTDHAALVALLRSHLYE